MRSDVPASRRDDRGRSCRGCSLGGVTTQEHRLGGIEFPFGCRELGRLRGSIADLPFPRPIRDELIAAGCARRHHGLPASGWGHGPYSSSGSNRAVSAEP